MSCLCFVFSMTKLVRKFCSYLNSFRSYIISFLFSSFYPIYFSSCFFYIWTFFWRPTLGPMATQSQPVYWPWNSSLVHLPLALTFSSICRNEPILTPRDQSLHHLSSHIPYDQSSYSLNAITIALPVHPFPSLLSLPSPGCLEPFPRNHLHVPFALINLTFTQLFMKPTCRHLHGRRER